MRKPPPGARRILWISAAILVAATPVVGWVAWDQLSVQQAQVAGDLLVGHDGRTLTTAVWWTDCEDRPALTAHETPRGVTVAIERRRHLNLHTTKKVCNGWQEAYVHTKLDSPLSSRTISSAVSGATITPFSEDNLRLPANLPPGFTPSNVPYAETSDSPYTRGTAPSWTSTYSRDRNSGWNGGTITITQAADQTTTQEATAQNATIVSVNGHTASLQPGNGGAGYTLDWSAEGYHFTVRVLDHHLTQDDTLHIAEQLP